MKASGKSRKKERRKTDKIGRKIVEQILKECFMFLEGRKKKKRNPVEVE